MKDTVIINEKDNVGVRLTATDKILAGHKFALKDIKKGEYIITVSYTHLTLPTKRIV